MLGCNYAVTALLLVAVIVVVNAPVFVSAISVHVLATNSSASASKPQHRQRRQRQVWAWASGTNATETAAQLRNSSWSGIVDGLEVWCGVSFSKTGVVIDQKGWDACAPILEACREQSLGFQVIVSGDVPEETIANPKSFINDIVAIAQAHPEITGISLDDERDCAPRANLQDLEDWMGFSKKLAMALHAVNLTLTSAIQGMFGIQREPDNQPCLYPPYNDKIRLPSAYPLEPSVVDLLNDSPTDQWLVMDTYYYSTGHFLTTLDWHSHYITDKSKLGIGMSNWINWRTNWTEDELQSRFYALHKNGIQWINIFMMPINDRFLPYLKRWKTHCQGCGVQPLLGCFDIDTKCVH